VMSAFYLENVGMTTVELEQMKSSPFWPARLATAHTLLRELQAAERYAFYAQRFKDLHIPTLLLAGGDSPDFIKAGTEAVGRALPHSRVFLMPGQGHIAMYTAPDLFLHELLTFLNRPR